MRQDNDALQPRQFELKQAGVIDSSAVDKIPEEKRRYRPGGVGEGEGLPLVVRCGVAVGPLPCCVDWWVSVCVVDSVCVRPLPLRGVAVGVGPILRQFLIASFLEP